jgi:phage-related protein
LKFFETIFLENIEQFLDRLDRKMVVKILYLIDLAEQTNDPKLFKKIQQDIWEFRIQHAGLQIRLLAFWDKSNNKQTLVVATYGFLKKTDKIPIREIKKAVLIKRKYFDTKI